MFFFNPNSISSFRKKELLFFIKQNKLPLKNLLLLDRAFTHSSYANESKEKILDNERLEFLGDSVLSLSISTYIYKFCEGDEGTFSKIRSYTVSENSLSEIAFSLQLDKYLLLGKGEEQSGGRKKNAILADCMEAVIAAVYLDCGFEIASEFILRNIKKILLHSHEDFKTRLQEFCQKKYKTVPVYNLISKDGPEHNSQFWVSVTVNNEQFGPANGHNKKDAQQNVAKIACQHFGLC